MPDEGSGAAMDQHRDVADGQLPILLVVHPDRDLPGRLESAATRRGLRLVGTTEADAAIAIARRAGVVGAVVCVGYRSLLDVVRGLRAAGVVGLVGVSDRKHSLGKRLAAIEAGLEVLIPFDADPAHLLDEVEAAVGRPMQAEGHVLVALDAGPSRTAAAGALVEAGLQATIADAASDLADILDSTEELDLLLVGARFDENRGPAVCQAVRGDARWAELPVLIVTEGLGGRLANEVARCGAEGVVLVPFDAAALGARVAGLLRRRRTLRRLAETDRLTGLANRHKLEEELARFAALAERLGEPLTLTLLDLDRFKLVNDRYGHLAGDEVLRELAAHLTASFRTADVVARWGGEEFAIASFGMSAAHGVRRAQEALALFAHRRFEVVAGESFSVSFSAGVAEFPRDTAALPDLWQAADAALYEAKLAGRRRVVRATGADARVANRQQ